ncbi:MAG: GntR family transcriptional regulator [Proteobacteria bacterium]|nr:GntR family transcriptional regulator [Pseudomonadota bacterium]
MGNNMVTISEALISKGIPFETTVLAKRIIPVDSKLATRLHTSADKSTVFFLKRIRFIEDEPVVLSHNYVRYDVCPGIEMLDFRQLRLFEVLEFHYGLHLERGRRTFQAQLVGEGIADSLEMAPGNTIMYLEQETYLGDGSLVEYSEVWMRGDRFKLTADMQRSGIHATVISSSEALTFDSRTALA